VQLIATIEDPAVIQRILALPGATFGVILWYMAEANCLRREEILGGGSRDKHEPGWRASGSMLLE
jgi:hypothetical protein